MDSSNGELKLSNETEVQGSIGHTCRPALEDRVVRTFASADVFAFPPLPPVVFEDMTNECG